MQTCRSAFPLSGLFNLVWDGALFLLIDYNHRGLLNIPDKTSGTRPKELEPVLHHFPRCCLSHQVFQSSTPSR